MNQELRTAIAKVGMLLSDITGGFWYIEAPAEVSEPYAVFSFLPSSYSRDTASKFEEHYLQINLYDVDGSNAEDLVKQIIAIFEDSEGAIIMPNYVCIAIDRQLMRNAKLDDVFQITIQYKIQLSEGYMSRIADFSTVEHLTGACWIDGKQIYRKVITTGAIEIGLTNVATGISDLETLVNMRFIGSYGEVDLSYHVSEQTVALDYTAIDGVWYVQVNSTEEFDGGFIILEYTKNN